MADILKTEMYEYFVAVLNRKLCSVINAWDVFKSWLDGHVFL